LLDSSVPSELSFPVLFSIDRPDGTAYACGATDSSPLPSHASKVQVSSSAISTLINHTALLSPSHLSTDNGQYSAEIIKEQACYLPVGSGDPVIGKIEGSSMERGVYVASGHSCWGICNGRSFCFLLPSSL
jgi:glycine/D-amino acid oxidase-like deaminating enzyme